MNAPGLKPFPPGHDAPNTTAHWDPDTYRGCCGTTSGRTSALKPLLNSKNPTSETSTGEAQRPWTTFCRDQPRRIALAIGPNFGDECHIVTPTEKALRISKSDGPRLALGSIPGKRILEAMKLEPADAVSMECAQV